MKLLLNCDQVFDVLTRGPFPTGEPSDEAVENHLRACFECRQLAEALRPAVALLHEAVTAEQAMALPEYHGSLPEPRSAARHQVKSPRSRSLVRGVRRLEQQGTRPHAVASDHLANRFRWIAAGGLAAALLMLLYGAATSSSSRDGVASHERPLLAASTTKPVPDAQGLLSLASLQLPATCFPPSHQPLSAARATTLAAAMADGSLLALHCCTECHHAGLPQPNSRQLVALAQKQCQTCHRG